MRTFDCIKTSGEQSLRKIDDAVVEVLAHRTYFTDLSTPSRHILLMRNCWSNVNQSLCGRIPHSASTGDSGGNSIACFPNTSDLRWSADGIRLQPSVIDPFQTNLVSDTRSVWEGTTTEGWRHG